MLSASSFNRGRFDHCCFSTNFDYDRSRFKLLKAQGIKRVASLNSMMSAKQKLAVMNQLGAYKLLYCSPEMLQQEQVQQVLSNKKIGLLCH